MNKETNAIASGPGRLTGRISTTDAVGAAADCATRHVVARTVAVTRAGDARVEVRAATGIDASQRGRARGRSLRG